MVRRSLGVALWMLAGLLACFLGALGSLVGTDAGRALLTRVTAGALHQVSTSTIEIGDVGGSLLTGLTLSQVRLFDADSTLVAWLPRADVSYNPFDFAAGRAVLFEFDLRRPVINIVQHPSGRLNIEELLRLGGPDTGKHGPTALILLRNVRVTDGSVTIVDDYWEARSIDVEVGDLIVLPKGYRPLGACITPDTAGRLPVARARRPGKGAIESGSSSVSTCRGLRSRAPTPRCGSSTSRAGSA